MLKKGIITLTAMVTLTAFVSTGWSFGSNAVIGKGTIALSGDLDLSFVMSDSKDKKNTYPDNETDSFGVNTGIGYFVMDNLELGLILSYESNTGSGDFDSTAESYKSDSDYTTFLIGPSVYYHLPVTENLFVIFGGGIGFAMEKDEYKEKGDYQYPNEEDGTMASIPYKLKETKDGNGIFYGLNLGIERFLTDSVSFTGTIRYLKIDMDGDRKIKQEDGGTAFPTDKSKFDQSLTQTGISVGARIYF